MYIRKTWRRMAEILMAVMLAFSSMDGCIAGMLSAYAESVQAEMQGETVLETASPNPMEISAQIAVPEASTEVTPETTVEPSESFEAEATAEATPEATVEPTESPEAEATPETAVAPTESPEAEATPEATVEPSENPDAPAAERSAIEAAIAENGDAYVRLSNVPASVYDAETLNETAEIGALTKAGSLLYAEKYIDRGEEPAAVLVCFDAADGEVKGYIRESDLEEAPVQLDDASKTWKDTSVRIWLDEERTKALPEAAFEPVEKSETENTPVEEMPIEETLLDPTLKARVAVDTANLRAKPNAESALVAQLIRDAEILLEGKIEIDGTVWYRLTYEGQTAYIRGDLVEVAEIEESAKCECGAVADADGNIVHAPDCPMAEGEECHCYDADGARLCAADCVCPCHNAENIAVQTANEEEQYLTIRVHWVGDEDKPEMRPQNNLYLYVKKDGRSTQYSTSVYTNWETKTTAPLKNADGSDCVYELDYVSTYLYPAYVVTEAKFENGVLDITFQHQPSIDYDLQITWSDDNDSNGLRPETLAAEDVALAYRGGSDTWTPDSIEKNEDGSWTAHFKNLPTYYRSSDGKAHICDPSAYRYEVQINGLKPNYQTGLVYGKYKQDAGDYERQCTYLTVQCTLQTVTVKATYRMQCYLSSGLSSEVNWAPSWRYAEALGIELPDSVRLTVLSNGTPIDRADATVTYERESSGAYPTMEKTWYLPKYDADGSEIDYGTLSVDYSPSLEKGELSGEFVQDVRKSGNLTVTISTQIYGISAVEMPVTWNDDSNALAVRPTTLSATLLKDGVPYGESVTLKVDAKGAVSGYPNSWKHLLQRDSDGHYIQYGIQLNDLPAYYDAAATASHAYSAESGYGKPTTNISKLNFNTAFTLKTQTAKATVRWEGDGVGSETELKNRPKAANLKLEYTTDGGATWQPFWGTDVFAVTMGENANEWTYEWSGLPAVDAQGNAVEYRAVPADTSSMYVTRVDEPQYEKDVDGNVTHSAFTIHNSYNDNWNYSIDLKWNEADPVEKYKIEKVASDPYTTYTVQYQLSISVQKSYGVGALQVRIPYELFDRRDGEGAGTVVSRFSLGPETNPSGNYSFTYRIDDKGTADTSDDEVVFYNYKPLNASDNCVIMVEYLIQPKDVVDYSLGSLTANATGRYDGQAEEEAQQSGPITYRVDTGVELIQHSKTVVGAKYYWDTNYGAQPDDFDMTKYNYVEYKVSAYWRWNQPNTLYFVEKPGNGGEVYRVRRYSTNIKFTANPETNEFIWTDSRTSANSASVDYYVLVRYPRIPHEDPLNPGQTTYEADYQNALEFHLIGDDPDSGAGDQNDTVIVTDETTMHWTDYEFHYNGELFSAAKTMSSFRTGALTVLEYGGDVETSCYLTMDVKGYNLKNGYSMEIKDDAVYLCATINGKTTDYVRLTEEDYEISGKPALAVTLTGVDRTNGQPISGQVPEGSFILWGRIAGGEWEEIDRLTMTSSYANVTLADITGKGYTQLRLTTPEDLQDEAYIVLRNFNIRLKGSSPKVAQWLKEDGLTMMTVQNLAAFNVYAKDDQGRMRWENPYAQSTNSSSQQRGLDEEDKAELGAYQYRRNYDTRLYPATESAQMVKQVDRPLDYDATQEIITARFSILEYETINNVSLPQEVYDAKCQNGAVIYDLLPKGFVYASDKGAQVFGANSTITTGAGASGVYYYEFRNGKDAAALVSVRTIDDYRGTGRQMVIFTLKSMLMDGKNFIADYSNWYTGFGVQFYARASYGDVVSGKTLYNITAAQRDDEKVISGGYTERGYGSTSREDIFVLDENGQRALYDVNNDGVVSEETNTMYGYAEVTPSMIQTIENGLAKTVKGMSGLYQKDDIVDLNGRYSYKLRLTAQKNGETSNVVLYDILENAANTGGASGELTGWKGTFVGVNTRVAKELGIAPVVLYSTEKLSYNDPDTLLIESNPDAWSTTPPEDLSTVTAIAFDLRTAADGSDFIFPEDSTVEVEIFMQAPDSIQPSEYAYNRPAYNSTFKPRAAQEGYTSFNISSRTTLKLRDLQDFEFIKQFVKDDDTIGPLANVRFSLYLCTNTGEGHKHDRPGSGTGCWGTAIRSTSSTTDGKVRFEDLDTGTYAIVEAYVGTGFDLLRNTYWIFTVDATKGTISDPVTLGAVQTDEVQMKQTDGAWTLLNQRTSIDIEIGKTWKDDGEQLIRPKTLIFDLYRNGELHRTQEVEAKSGSLGVVFKNVPIYDEYGNNFTYKAVERVPEGYTEQNGGTADVSTAISKRQYVQFTNTRLGVLDVTKRVQGSDTTAPFGFTIVLTDASGNPLKLAEGETIAARRFAESAENYIEEALTLDAEGKIHVFIAPDETLRLIGLPQGTRWQVDEDENAYTTTVSPNPAIGSTGATVNPSVVFTNIPQPAELSLSVRKAVEGNVPENGEKAFTFKIVAVTENAPMPQSDTVSVIGSGTAAFDAIQFSAVGEYIYTVSEQAGSEKGYTYDETVYTATAKVVDENGVLKAEWTIQDGTETADEVLFTNRYEPEPVNLKIVKSDSTNSAKRLSGATFSLYSDADCVNRVTVWLDEAKMRPAETFTTGADGSVTVYGLAFGTYYLKELAAPGGYFLIEGALTVFVDEDGVRLDEEDDRITVNNDGDTHEITVYDSPISNLPATGGRGAWSFYAAGLALMLLAAAVARRRCERESGART